VSAEPSSTPPRRTPDPRLPVKARNILRVRAVWTAPLILGAVVVALMTALYIGSVIDPLAHLRGLPVAIVNQDRGASVAGRHLDVGQQVETGLTGSQAVSSRLHLELSNLSQAQQAMGRGDLYATMVIPPDLTANLLTAAGLQAGRTSTIAEPRISILTNTQAGTIGASLASGVLQPALAVASQQVGRQLAAVVSPSAQTAATSLFLADPITVTTSNYRPLASHTALGLSAFYVALLTLLGGFLAGTLVNSVVDSALGYATSEVGPRWGQRAPVPISRWQTLLVKGAVVPVLAAVVMAVIILVAAAGFGMDTPYPALLWAYTWLCATSVGIGTVVLFAVAGTAGQLLALLIFVYAGLASAGGTVPVQALPAFLRVLSNVEPLRQILDGIRSILYFGAQADAGLARGTLLAGVGLVFWVVLGAAIVRWYDRKGLYRLNPDVLAYVSNAVEGYMAKTDPATTADPTSSTSSTTSEPEPKSRESSPPNGHPASPGRTGPADD
jgi:YhgE/Pip-like protein